MLIGLMIKNEREAVDKTRREVVDKLGITEPYLFAIESGKKHPQIPKGRDGHLDIKGSLYYRILTRGLDKTPEDAESLILDVLLQEIGPSHPSLRLLLRDELTGRMSPEDRRAIMALYEGLKLIRNY
jgi:transcriptional regulator with XRE-family HTH domain